MEQLATHVNILALANSLRVDLPKLSDVVELRMVTPVMKVDGLTMALDVVDGVNLTLDVVDGLTSPRWVQKEPLAIGTHILSSSD